MYEMKKKTARQCVSKAKFLPRFHSVSYGIMSCDKIVSSLIDAKLCVYLRYA